MLQGFKEFIAKGNAVDLAVGVVIGAAFTGVVDALVKWLIMPLIAAIAGKPDFSKLGVVTINHAQFQFGTILTAIINFLLVALAIYFFVVVPMNMLRNHRKQGEPEPAAEPTELDVLNDIKQLLAKQGK